MTKRETFALLSLIAIYYEQFELNQQRVDSWFAVLKDHSYELLEKNLLVYVTKSPYPPKISELFQIQPVNSRVVPNEESTSFLLQMPYEPAKEEVVQEELRKMRELLGIKRGNY